MSSEVGSDAVSRSHRLIARAEALRARARELRRAAELVEQRAQEIHTRAEEMRSNSEQRGPAAAPEPRESEPRMASAQGDGRGRPHGQIQKRRTG